MIFGTQLANTQSRRHHKNVQLHIYFWCGYMLLPISLNLYYIILNYTHNIQRVRHNVYKHLQLHTQVLKRRTAQTRSVWEVQGYPVKYTGYQLIRLM